ncbi:MAG TPA: glycosyltransferase family 2 protein [Thermoanaerobaculia bacterium]|nr:glycosyltransferase family 2 protein [Thermoanaerobaculia bacterium]
MPRVTVIIPTYNWSTVLPFSIGSVLAQTFTDFELLVIGDGCTDDSETVVRAIGDPRVQWINIARTGHQSGPNNEGLRRARGEIIAYLGHDDLWLPHHLALHVAGIDRSTDLTVTLAAMIGPDDSFIESPRPDLSRGSGIVPGTIAHRRGAVSGWRDFRELTEPPERELIRRIVASGARTVVLPRLTLLKLSAALRRDVYRIRPAHEQSAWLARIRAEPDLEAALFGRMLAANTHYLDGTAQRLWRLLRQPSQWWAFMWRRGGNQIRARQRFKGVD